MPDPARQRVETQAARPNPAGALLGLIDKRSAKQMPRTMTMHGTYHDLGTERYVDLDTGERVPNPSTWLLVRSGRRYPCFFMQDGHDVMVLGDDVIPSESLSWLNPIGFGRVAGDPEPYEGWSGYYQATPPEWYDLLEGDLMVAMFYQWGNAGTSSGGSAADLTADDPDKWTFWFRDQITVHINMGWTTLDMLVDLQIYWAVRGPSEPDSYVFTPADPFWTIPQMNIGGISGHDIYAETNGVLAFLRNYASPGEVEVMDGPGSVPHTYADFDGPILSPVDTSDIPNGDEVAVFATATGVWTNTDVADLDADIQVPMPPGPSHGFSIYWNTGKPDLWAMVFEISISAGRFKGSADWEFDWPDDDTPTVPGKVIGAVMNVRRTDL